MFKCLSFIRRNFYLSTLPVFIWSWCVCGGCPFSCVNRSLADLRMLPSLVAILNWSPAVIFGNKVCLGRHLHFRCQNGRHRLDHHRTSLVDHWQLSDLSINWLIFFFQGKHPKHDGAAQGDFVGQWRCRKVSFDTSVYVRRGKCISRLSFRDVCGLFDLWPVDIWIVCVTRIWRLTSLF